MTTSVATQWWERHASLKGAAWAEAYWNDWQAPHRQQIVIALGLLAPVASLYEIGCNSGPNLRLIWQSAPHLKLGGLEMTKVAADMAHVKLGIPIDHGHLPEDLPDTEWDVVLSCYTLAYLDPDDAHAAMLNMHRMAHQAILLVEPCAVGGLPLGQCRDDGLPEWRHDYERTFGALGWQVAWKWPILPPVQNLNVLSVFTRV